MDERDDDDLRLPSPTVLDTWAVPEPGSELADRIADAWQDERLSRAEVPRRPRLRGALGVTLGAAVGAAAAVLVMLLVRAPAAAPLDSERAPIPEPAALVGPTAPAPVIQVATDDDLAEVKGDLERLRHQLERSDAERDEFLLVLDVEPDDARVHVTMGEREVADVVGDARLLLPRERYDVVAEAAGHEPMKLSAAPAEGAETRHDLRLTRIPREPRGGGVFRGLFKRKAKPRATSSEDLKNPFKRLDDAVKSAKVRIGTKSGVPPARVYLDGKLIGATPIASYAVTPGRHTVEWQWEDGRTITQTVELEADTVRVLKGG